MKKIKVEVWGQHISVDVMERRSHNTIEVSEEEYVELKTLAEEINREILNIKCAFEQSLAGKRIDQLLDNYQQKIDQVRMG